MTDRGVFGQKGWGSSNLVEEAGDGKFAFDEGIDKERRWWREGDWVF